jgi:O-antigen ligase
LRAAAGGGIVIALLLVALLFGGEESLNRLLGSVNAEDPTTGRAHFWRGTLDIFRANPWLGAGLGAFSAAYPRYDTGGGLYRLEQAHNDYLQLLSDGGVVGGLLGVIFVALLFRGALRGMQSESPLRRGLALGGLAGCFAALVHSFFDFPLHTAANGLLFLTLAAIATAAGAGAEPKRRRRSSRRPHAAATAGAATTKPDEIEPVGGDGGDQRTRHGGGGYDSANRVKTLGEKQAAFNCNRL